MEKGYKMEKDLINRARNRDNEAIAEIIQFTERKAYFIAYKVVNNEATAKDIVQEAYIQAFQKLDQLTDDSKFESWFNQIVSHKALDYTKSKQGKNKPVEFSSLDDEEDRLDFEANIKNDKAIFEPEANMNYKELQEGVQHVLEELPDNQRLALMMYYFEDMSVSEIADVYGVSGNTVKGYLSYGRKKIKNIIESMREKGISFYVVAPMPFLTWMLHDQMTKTAVSHVSKDIIIKTVGTTAATTTAASASKSGFAKWWASKTASVKAGICAGTVAVTGGVGYAAIDYNSNYNQIVRAVDKLNDLDAYYVEFNALDSNEEPFTRRTYIRNTVNNDEYYGAYVAHLGLIEYKVEDDEISYSFVEDADLDNITDCDFENHLKASKKNMDEYAYVANGTKAFYTYCIVGQNLKPQLALLNAEEKQDQDKAKKQLNQWKQVIKKSLNSADVSVDENGNKTYKYTSVIQQVDEDMNSTVNKSDSKQSYVTINKDGYIIRKQIIRTTDNKVVEEWNFDIDLED